jgi:fermentation-respiration switch protein FrsA (DUF1100 family)
MRGQNPGAVAAVLCLFLLLSGCTGTPAKEASYGVGEDGFLQVSCPAPAALEQTVLLENSSLILTRVVFRSVNGDVYGLLAVPPVPRYGIVLAPGAGVTKEDERSRAVTYAMAGCACLVLDLRGNGGETAGEPFSLDRDYQAFVRGEWPETYATVCDLSSARQILADRYSVPVYAMGASNGGRWAAVAATADPGYAGYIGVSTSGFGLAGNGYTGSARRFLLSIDPEHTIGTISPRPVYLFHSPRDTIIPFAQGKALFDRAGEPKAFITFNGTHGENDEVDRHLTRFCGGEGMGE